MARIAPTLVHRVHRGGAVTRHSARRPNTSAQRAAPELLRPSRPPLHTPRPRPLSPPSRRSPPQHVAGGADIMAPIAPTVVHRKRGRPGRRAAGGGGSEEGHGGDVHRAQSAQGGNGPAGGAAGGGRRAAGGGCERQAAAAAARRSLGVMCTVRRARKVGMDRRGAGGAGGRRAAGGGRRVAGGGRCCRRWAGGKWMTATMRRGSRWGCGGGQYIGPPPAAQPHLADVRRRPIRDYPDVLNTFALRLRPRTHRMRPRAHDRAVPHRDDHGRRRRRFERRSVSLSRDLEHCVLHILLPYAPRLTRGEPYCCARASSTVHHVLRRRIRTTPFEHSTGHARPRVAAARQSTGETKEARSSSARTPIYTPRPLRPSESAQRESRCMDPESIGRAARRTDGGLEHTHRTRRFQPASHRVPPPNPRSTTPARAPNFRRPSAAQSRGNLRGGAGSRSVKGATALSGRVCNYIQCVRYSRGSPHPRPHGHLSTECPATTPTINTSAHLIDADAVNCVVRRLPRDFSGASPSVIGECTQHPTTPQLRHLTLLPPAPAPHVSYEIFDAVDAA
ncbi:hypothetical protein B0H11DRAFT_2247093 [Mycena galericulata]|nr:hypothetical protein B0H11DRAFT_2247093 [Mycena galericulata]